MNVGLIFSSITKLIPKLIHGCERLFKGRLEAGPAAEEGPSEDPGGDRLFGAPSNWFSLGCRDNSSHCWRSGAGEGLVPVSRFTWFLPFGKARIGM